MKILVVSGFLGAGKTTFIQEMMRHVKRQFVILENEYGSTDVDQQVLEQQDAAEVWNLTEGCVCCTKSADLNASVATIESTLSPEFLIVEPSGVGALSNVLRNLQRIQYERIQLLRPVTVLNARGFLQDWEQYGDVYQDQIRTAGTIVISQPEHVDAELHDAVTSKISALSPAAELLPVHYTNMDDEWWEALLATDYEGRKLEKVNESALGMESFPIKGCRVDNPVALMWVLEAALNGAFGQIVRAKGLLQAGPAWVRFDIAAGRYSIVGLDEEESRNAKPECVFIGHAIDMVALRKAMQPLPLQQEPHPEDATREETACEGTAHHHDCCACHHHEEEHAAKLSRPA